MRRAALVLLPLAALALAEVAPLGAQGTKAPADTRHARPDSVVLLMDSVHVRLDTLRGRNLVARDSLQSLMLQAFVRRRVRIGVVVSTLPSATDSVGARIDAVTPGGPAAMAGLRAGDILTRFGPTPLAVSLTDLPPGTRVTSPGFRLVDLVAKLAPNDTVTVEYRRGSTRGSTRVVTAAEPDQLQVVVSPEGSYDFRAMPGAAEYWVGRGGADRALDLALLRSQAARGAAAEADSPFSLYFGGPLRDLELASVNPQLGSYFGTTDGVLVVDVPDRPPLGLRAGDVVLSVDGRAVSSPRQLMRILESYEPGERMRLEVMRQKKRIALAGVLGR